MTEPEDSHTSTRPISVAELLAKNGNIGSPPVGGRRRRRRGNSDSVTVAELTGEIPIITDTSELELHPDGAAADTDDESDTTAEPEPKPEAKAPRSATNGSYAHARPHGRAQPPVEADEDASPAATEAEADYDAHLEQRAAEPEPIEFTPPPRRPQSATSTGRSAPTGGAEQMSPDPVIEDDDELDPNDELIESLEFETPLEAEPDELDEQATQVAYEVPSYLRSNSDTLFGGGQSVADDIARRGLQPGPEDIDLDDEADSADELDTKAAQPRGGALVRGAWVVAQCILAVAFGAGLFIAFDLLWKWNNIVALVLSVLVILGLVVGVRVVRKTEDIGSTLIAVAVGALVTLGPLALLQSH